MDQQDATNLKDFWKVNNEAGLRLKLRKLLAKLGIKSAILSPLDEFIHTFDFEALYGSSKPSTIYVSPQNLKDIEQIYGVKIEKTDIN